MTLASNLVQNNEGCELGCYTDTTGNPTIGVGYNLNADSANIASVGSGYSISSLENCSQCLSNADAQTLLTDTLGQAQSCAMGLISNWSSLPATAQAVAIDMSFNLGCGGFGQFVNTISAINNQNWSGAVSGMQNSAWCGQVGNRCSTDCQMMSSSSSCSSAGTTSYTQKNKNSSSSNRPLVLGLSITFSILGAAIIATVVVVAVVVIRRRRAAAAATPNGQLDQQLLDTQYVAQRNAL